MKPDPEYMRNLLVTLQESARCWPTTGELDQAGIEVSEKLVFHLELLDDQGLIQSKAEDGLFGVEDVTDGEVYWADTALRLTASGHEFIEAMNQPEIWTIVKE